MKSKFKLSAVSLTLAAILGGSNVSLAATSEISYFKPSAAMKTAGVDSYEFLKANQKKFSLESLIDDLVLVEARQSLLGTHYRYKQQYQGIDVLNAEVVVSINNQGEAFRLFNSSVAISAEQQKAASFESKISAEQALEKSWGHIQGHGEVTSMPTSELVFWNNHGELQLIYKTIINGSAPRGQWQQYVDAKTGEVLFTTRTDLPNKTNANDGSDNGNWTAFSANKQHQALSVFIKELAAKQIVSKASANKASGSAQVFDPNPVISLRDDTLEDGSAIASGAYFTRTLLDITESGGTYSLVGPWVNIQNFEDPATAPSTTNDGNWTATRGDNAFNDANTYYHLDTNQRYMQGLGFSGVKGIQETSINVDTDGWGGADNSSYTSGINRLSFGHGCVDDNEDSDVIFHEYGHAINYSINSSWGGGDTGAMGEGFGDYWAGSYRMSTPNNDYHPEWVFSWDGHNNCWGGRVMDRISYSYDPTKTYGAHQNVNGENGDELWSTPLFQSLLEILNQGGTREEVDRIILEAQFGLGSGLKMPDMAQSIVTTAETLYPAGVHAGIFNSKFTQVDIPTTLSGGGGNQAPVANVAQSSITVDEGASVTLDASSSSDPDGDGLSFSWDQTSGSTVSLSNANTDTASFTAPSVSSDSSFVFEVSVTDGQVTSKATVTVTVRDTSTPPPTGGSGGGGGSTGLLSLLLLSVVAGFRRKFKK